MTKSTKWFLGILGVLAFFTLIFFVLIFSAINVGGERTEFVTIGNGEKIGVVELTGVITSSEDVVRQLKKYREDKSIRAILLHVDSPGGAVVPSQEMYDEVRKTRASGKPVVVSMGSLAASGGYYVAVGASKLVANPGSLTGSIGVISEFLQVQEALNKLGIDVKTIKSGKLKDAGSPVSQMSDEARSYFQQLMDDVHKQFIAVVEKERKLTHEEVLALADGRVFTGEQAVTLGLVDTLGTFEDAIAITGELAGIEGKPSLVRERRRRGLFESLFGDVAESMNKLSEDVLHRSVLSYRFVGP